MKKTTIIFFLKIGLIFLVLVFSQLAFNQSNSLVAQTSNIEDNTQGTTISAVANDGILIIPTSPPRPNDEVMDLSGTPMLIVTANEIKKWGARSLENVIEYVAVNFYTSNDGIWNYLGVRGMGLQGSYANRISILINNYPIADHLYGSVLNKLKFGISVDFIDRIEFYPIPGALILATTGTLASINIITKRGFDIDGGIVSVEGNSLGRVQGEVLIGKYFEDANLDVMFSTKYEHYAGQDLYFKEFDETTEYGDINSPLYNPRATNQGIANKRDGYNQFTTYLNVKYSGFELNTQFLYANAGYATATVGSIFNDPEAKEVVQFANVNLSKEFRFGGVKKEHKLTSALYLNYASFDSYFNYDGYGENNDLILYQIEAPRNLIAGVQVMDNWEISEVKTLLLGVNYTADIEQEYYLFEGNTSNPTENIFENPNNAIGRFSNISIFGRYTQSFGYNEIFKIFLGGRYDIASPYLSSNYNTTIFNPQITLLLTPYETSSINLFYSTATRMPSGYEVFSSLDTNGNMLGGFDLKYEKTTTIQLRYIQKIKSFSTNFSLYYNTLQDLIFFDTLTDNSKPDPEAKFYFRNAGVTVHNYGFSNLAKYTFDFGLDLYLGCFLAFVDYSDYNVMFDEMVKTNSPRWYMLYRVSYELIDHLFVNLFGMYGTSKKTINLVDLPAMHRIELGFTYNPNYTSDKYKWLNSYFAGIKFQNLLNAKHFSPVTFNELPLTSYPLNGFSINFTLGKTF